MTPLKFSGAPQSVVDDIIDNESCVLVEVYLQQLVGCLEYVSDEDLIVVITETTIDIHCYVGMEYKSALTFEAMKNGFVLEWSDAENQKLKCVLTLHAKENIMNTKTNTAATAATEPAVVLVTPVAAVAPVATPAAPVATTSPINESIEVTLRSVLLSVESVGSMSKSADESAKAAAESANLAKAAAATATAAAATITASAAAQAKLIEDMAKLTADMEAQKLASGAKDKAKPAESEESFFDTTTGKVVGWGTAALVVGGLAYAGFNYFTGGKISAGEATVQ